MSYWILSHRACCNEGKQEMTLMQCNINHAFFVTGTYTVDAEPRWEERRENERERERERWKKLTQS